MTQIVVNGMQWGDEGKGKIVDWLSEKADIIVRFQGGHNAGHTIVVNGQKFKLSLLPSGILRQGKLCVIGNGVVLDPWVFFDEIEMLQKSGVEISMDQIKLAENIPLILSLHKELDVMKEELRGEKKIGTTGRGIGPAYEDKVGRRAILLSDLKDPRRLHDKLKILVHHHNALRKGLGMGQVSLDIIYNDLLNIAPKILPYSAVVWKLLDEATENGKSILFEGAQGSLLDIDHGTYPYVTSSNTVTAQASIGSGLGMNKIKHALGVCKAYTTRVGSGPFPTEQQNEVGQFLSEKGFEFGTVTGRERRCGWLDAILVRQSAKLNGLDGIIMTKIDVLNELDEIKICVGYRLQDKIIDYYPGSIEDQQNIKPIYETLPGWKMDISKIKNPKELPENLKNYLSRVEELSGLPIVMLSTSPEREDTFVLREDFFNGENGISPSPISMAS